jgi:ribonucleoside-diphosphate reductase alpha chain
MIHVDRLFTKAGQDVYNTCSWKKVHCKITEGEKIICELIDAEFPEHYSQTACDIVASKYFRRAGVPIFKHRVVDTDVPIRYQRSEPDEGQEKNTGAEISLKNCIDRMVGHWTYWAAKMKIVDDLDAFSDELKYMILHQMWSPNSPQWFNAGLNWAYGTKPKNEGYYTINGPYTEGVYEQMHACFIQPVEDAMFGESSIFEALENEARIFKKGSGTGTNFSKLRAKGERLSGG